ncbi:class I SAM-dependent methyltransferase [Klenkia brasiliensis]|uniref:Ubiquinone/menaquinone biosynthesis C-methylase UbiE n=1 Tax=Klenkia brasiliensis TaxID=333142 RepID=A0A1G7YVG5_9ACTN|nr:class I SAM-dependent methyltransferase [Klenkia brasiliensis]SDG99820.1 Ubiquinone/menaquinone biosynthesis C-methylase UbiE [Klenkia brasiliensis]
MSHAATSFHGSMPAAYEDGLVPVLFEPYAAVVADRVAASGPRRVLEVSAGTGVLTRALAARLPGADVLATDLSPAMVELAARISARPGVRWQQADALALPAGDCTVDVVTSQFGLMFVPDPVAAHREARRVLVDGGRLVVAVWGHLAGNGLAAALDAALRARWPDATTTFVGRTPHGYGDPDRVAADATAAGFRDVQVETVALVSRAPSASGVVRAFLAGTPLGIEVLEREGSTEGAAADLVAEVARRFGDHPVEAPMTALLLTATR